VSAIVVRVSKDMKRRTAPPFASIPTPRCWVNKQGEPIGTAHLRTGAARIAREEPDEDHLTRARSIVMGALMSAKIRKNDTVIVLAGKDKGRQARCSW